MNTNVSLLIVILCLIGCKEKRDSQALKQEIEAAEKAFNDHAAKHGVKDAFLAFAHDEAVINRNNTIISGKDSIEHYFNNQSLKNVKLQWKPDFIDVASSGDMAYTYGKYTFSAMRPDSTQVNASGIFHTVWKKDENGDWKYVYD